MRGRPSKLTDAARADILAWAEQWNSIPARKEIAARWGVSEATVSAVAKGINIGSKPLDTSDLEQMASELLGEKFVPRLTSN